MAGLTASQVKKPGAYEWHDTEGHRHLGFIRADKRGKLQGSFVRDDNASIAVSLGYGNDEYCKGLFFGPLLAAN